MEVKKKKGSSKLPPKRTGSRKGSVVKITPVDLSSLALTTPVAIPVSISSRIGQIAIYFLVAVFSIAGGLAYYQLAFAQRIYPGVAVGKLSLAGYKPTEAADILRQNWIKFTEQGIPLIVQGRKIVLTNLVTSATDPDLTYELMRYDPSAVAQAAYLKGREGSWLARLIEPICFSLFDTTVSTRAVEVETDRILQYVRDILPGVEQQPVSAKLVVDFADNITVEPEVPGRVIDQQKLAAILYERLASLSFEPVMIDLVPLSPSLNETSVIQLLPEARRLLLDKNIEFFYRDRKWTAEPAVWHRWLGAVLDSEAGSARLTFLPEQTEEFFGPLEGEINQPARDAKFEIRDGRVVAFQGSWQGRQVDRQATLAKAFSSIVDGRDEPVELAVSITEPNLTTSETNDFGISEIIGVGHSNFKGSPPNRRHNIKVGAQALNGLLIRDGEEFSLLKALLPVDASTGYLPELVIKGNRTIPEYGGGLCQIGTTIFRAALASGLPITERRNHSYRVVYYEPAGIDATIYDPAPDFKFLNDTGGSILIQTRIEGDDLYFEFWGRPDGRVVNQTKPRIFNITPPPPTKIIETEDLSVGEKKCTEKPHSGADTEFTYTVRYANGEVKQQVFKSHYIPWQEVCLLGVPKGTLTPTVEGVSTSTTEIPSATEGFVLSAANS